MKKVGGKIQAITIWLGQKRQDPSRQKEAMYFIFSTPTPVHKRNQKKAGCSAHELQADTV